MIQSLRCWAMLFFCHTFGQAAIAALLTSTACGQEVPVTVARIEERVVSSTRRFAGTLHAYRTSTIGSSQAATVVERFVQEGDFVKARQPLVRLDSSSQEIQIAAAKAELSLRRQELQELTNGSRPEEVAIAEAKAAGAKSFYELQQGMYDRIRSLDAQPRAVSVDEEQQAQNAAQNARQLLLQANAELELLRAGPRAERIAQAEARVAIAEQAQALLHTELQKRTIAAPFDGYITSLETEVGQWLSPGDPVVRMVDLHQVYVEALVVEDIHADLALGMEAIIEFNALLPRRFMGTIERILPEAELRSRTIPIKILLTNEQDEGGPVLIPGMLASVSLPVGEKTPSLLAPKDAVVLGQERPHLMVIDQTGADEKKGKVRQVFVDLGAAQDNLIQVNVTRDNLQAGMLVIVQGNERVANGQTVNIVKTVESPPLAAEAHKVAGTLPPATEKN